MKMKSKSEVNKLVGISANEVGKRCILIVFNQKNRDVDSFLVRFVTGEKCESANREDGALRHEA